MPFKPNSFFKFNVNHYDFFINLRDLHKIFYTLFVSALNQIQTPQHIQPSGDWKSPAIFRTSFFILKISERFWPIAFRISWEWMPPLLKWRAIWLRLLPIFPNSEINFFGSGISATSSYFAMTFPLINWRRMYSESDRPAAFAFSDMISYWTSVSRRLIWCV